MSVPQVPPRPARSQQQTMEMPKIPPRPGHRLSERSVSPNPDTFARSPLNELNAGGNVSRSMYSLSSPNASSIGLGLQRPPSVSLPSIGQEGNEYGDLEYNNPEEAVMDSSSGTTSSTQFKNVGSDLPLHAPKPSLSSSDAKFRVETVTRTDSSRAAAFGIGKAQTPIAVDDKEPHLRTMKSRSSFTRTVSSASTERPSSIHVQELEQGIPEIGQRVPMYPNAGDVQAPSPSPYAQSFPSGLGFHNDGTQKSGSKHHSHTRSGREQFNGPPGSYGLHGHGTPNNDQFEKQWYEKHPDALSREEHGQYGPGLDVNRGEWALSSEDLNKIVRNTASRGAGFGTSTIPGYPDEQIGYMASEEYTSRKNSPHPQPATYNNKSQSNHSQTHVDSPLRKTSFPVDTENRNSFNESKGAGVAARVSSSSDNALESETEDDDIIHINPPTVRKSKIHGHGYDPPTVDLGPHGGNTEAEGGYIDETGYGVPILASDEVAKSPAAAFMQPAVSPAQERRGSSYHTGVDSDVPLSYLSGHRSGSRSGSQAGSRTGSISGSRPTSRPASLYGSLPILARFTSHEDREDMHTPLEDVDEYEPLFPEEECTEGKPNTAIERFKLRERMMKRFPSQDVWEDTPNSLQLQATVETPEPNEEQQASATKPPSAVFETPEMEAARKGEVSEAEKAKLMPREERLAKSNFKPHLREEGQRPGTLQRFPSRDIWEDSPDSSRLETTVGGPQGDDHKGPIDEGLIAGAVVQTSGRPNVGMVMGDQARNGATAGTAAIEKPSIPPRPTKSKLSEEAQERSVQSPPAMPARPAKKAQQVPLAEMPPSVGTTSAEVSPTEAKPATPTEPRKGPVLPDRPKPQVPARPSKPVARDSSETVPLSKTVSAASAGSAGASDDASAKSITSHPPAPKLKPVIPARPVGGKIAALKAGFLSDLDKRLQLGPQGPKPQEKPSTEEGREEEKAPLTDARKGRARGPVRRKPAAAESSVDSEAEQKTKWKVQAPWTIWQTGDDGNVDVIHAISKTEPNSTGEAAEADSVSVSLQEHTEEASEALPPALTTNTAGDRVVGQSEIPTATEHEEDITKLSTHEQSQQSPDVDTTEATPTTLELNAADTGSLRDKQPLSQSYRSEATTAQDPMAQKSDQINQTGEKSIRMAPEGASGADQGQKLTAYIGGMAQEDADVVVRE